MGESAYQIHITPLFRGVPDEIEDDITGRSEITEEDLILIPQFGDLEVSPVRIGEGRVAKFKVNMHEPVTAGLKPFQFAVRIGFLRPLEVQYEVIFWGQCNIRRRFKDGYIEFEAHDPLALKAKYHQVRRGDVALNVDPERGREPSDINGMYEIFLAAHNTQPQQDREMPCFAFPINIWGNFDAIEDPPLIGFERFTPVYNLYEQIIKSVYGPDVDATPQWTLPANQYGWIDCYDPITDYESPTPDTELGRNFIPEDPDDPAPGDLIFSFGDVDHPELDNCVDVQIDSERPTTHAHYFDSHRVYRQTAADASSSALVGAWVDAVDAGFEIKRSEPGFPADTRPLEYLAEQHVRAYGRPPEHITLVLRPVDAPQMASMQFGHPRWTSAMPGVVVGGNWYLGDYGWVRARKGYSEYDGPVKILGVKFIQEGFKGLPIIQVEVVPVITGEPGPNEDEDDS